MSDSSKQISETPAAEVPDDGAVWPQVLLIVAVMLGFAFYTGQVWEDFLITFRQSQNLAEGHGLVYQLGERVQGFTSPLNVLVPALACKLCPQSGYLGPLWAFRIFALVVLSLGLGFFLRRGGAGAWRWLCVGLVALQVKTVAFAMNGQEAALMLGFLAPSVIAAARGYGGAWRLAGLSWAGLMWSRPDCPVYIAAFAIAGLLFSGEPIRAQLAGLAKAAALTTAIYGPWFAWTWMYYGTPVPHTITAKFGTGPQFESGFAWVAHYFATGWQAIGGGFEAIYVVAGGWPAWVFVLTRSLGLVCAFRWLLPGDRISRIASWVFFCGAGYLAFVGTVGFLYPWYLPPLGFCGAVVLARGFAGRWSRWRSAGARRGLVLAAGGVGAALAWVAVFGFEQQRVRQIYVERGVREPLGRWLGAHVAATERVFLEPIGYIGYFSGAHLLDYPGLVSPAVVQARREGARTFLDLIRVLRPEWVVFRGAEFRLAMKVPSFAEHYEPVEEFNAPREILAYRAFPGWGYIFADTSFVVSRRRMAPAGNTRTSDNTAPSAPRSTSNESGPTAPPSRSG